MHHITTYVSHHLSNVTYTVLSKHSGCDQLSFNVETINFQCGSTISNKFHFLKAVVGLLFREHLMVFPCCWVPGQTMKPRTHGWLEVEREAVSKSKTERWRPSPRMGKMCTSLKMGERWVAEERHMSQKCWSKRLTTLGRLFTKHQPLLLHMRYLLLMAQAGKGFIFFQLASFTYQSWCYFL